MATSTMMATGTFLAKNAEVSVRGDKVGFLPRTVRIYNEAGGVLFWSSDMADGAALTWGTTGTFANVTSDGVTPLHDGFTLGVVSDINDADGEVCYFVVTG